ncbi:MAG: VWA domain-containing protein [Acidobacteria bacterium]|jgi:VWFA-related protein|nr:VWA domain-containing protein [Acidobacteriota bacterium]
MLPGARHAIALCLFAAPAAAQEPGPPVFSAGAEVVLLDLVVRDEKGRIVDDLRPEEIQVYEDGELCPIQSFRLVRADIEVTPSAPVPGEATAGPPAAAVPVEEERRLTSVVVLVFDLLTHDPARRARRAALDMLKKPFPPGTVFATFKVGQGLVMLHPFTDDPSSLKESIERATAGGERPREAAMNPNFDSATEEAFAAMLGSMSATVGDRGEGAAEAAMAESEAQMLRFADVLNREARGHGSLYPLMAIARSLANVQGRKTLLYFSEGVEVPPAVEEAFRSTLSQANRANVSIYAFDTRGLQSTSTFEETRSSVTVSRWGSRRAMTRRSGAVSKSEIQAPEIAMESLRLNRQATLQQMAETTGGFLTANTNDLRKGLERAAADLREYYEIAYTPANPTPDGQWRNIEVKLSREDVEIRTRRGYFALPPGVPIVRPSELPLMAALEARTPPRDVPHRAAALPLAMAGDGRDTVILVKVPLSSLTFEPDETAGVWRAELRLLGLVRNEHGELVARMTHQTPLEGPLSEAEAARRQNVVIRRWLSLGPGRYTIETAVQDHGAQRMGVTRGAFEIPVDGGLDLGSLILVRPQPVAADVVDADPLRVGDVRGVPRLGDPVVLGRDPVVAVFLSLHPDENPEPPRLTLEISQRGQVVGRATPDLPEPDASGRVAYLGEFPADRFAPGRYVIRAVARQGTEESTTATSFRVVANTAPPPTPPAAPASSPVSTGDGPSPSPR